MDDRVGTLAVHVRTDLDGRDDELRGVAEQLTRDVVERVSLVLEARAPGRVIVLRTLPVHVALTEQEGTSSERLRSVVERVAEQIAAAIETSLPRDTREPEVDSDVAVFVDEGAFVASALLARARGVVAWFHAGALRGEPFERVGSDRRLAFAVMLALADRDGLIEVLAFAPPGVVARLAEIVARDMRGAPPTSTEDAAIVLGLVERISAWRGIDPIVRRLAAHVYAHAAAATPGSRITSVGSERVAGWAERALAIAAPGRSLVPSVELLDPNTPVTSADDSDAVAELARDPITAHAGLFYLLRPILELALAESLWRACLPEGVLIAHALRALVPVEAARDPAFDVIVGDATDVAAIDDISVADEQIHEVVNATLATVVMALPRGGRAQLPAGHARFVDHSTGRLLVVTAIDAPFVLFAWPVVEPADALAALAAVFARWPAATALHGSPQLIELDRSGRLRYTPLSPPAPLLVDAGSVTAVALASVVVGAPCQLVAARVGDRVDDALTWSAERLARFGRIVRSAEAVEVWQPSDAVDVDIRAAGIDRDPGFIPWLGIDLRLRFEDV